MNKLKLKSYRFIMSQTFHIFHNYKIWLFKFEKPFIKHAVYSFHKTLRQLRFSSLISMWVCTCHKIYHMYSCKCFLFQCAAATVEPPQTDSSEYHPDVPGISDRRTGWLLLNCSLPENCWAVPCVIVSAYCCIP